MFMPEPFNMSKFTNSYPHHRGHCVGQQWTHTVRKWINSVATYKQQLTVFVPLVVPLVYDKNEITLTPYVHNESKTASPTKDDNDTVSIASKSLLDDYPEDNNIQSVMFKPIIACPGILSQVESTIRHVHVCQYTNNAPFPTSIPAIINSTGDESYNIASICFADEFLCTNKQNLLPRWHVFLLITNF